MDPDRNMGKLQLVLVLAFVVGAFALSKLLETTYEPPGERLNEDRVLIVETHTVSPTSHQIAFNTSGLVEARSQIGIVPEATGRVIQVHDAFFSGGVFNTDEVLFKVDPRDFRQIVAQRQAEVERLQAALELSQAQVDAAIADWKRTNGNQPIPTLVAKEPQLKQAQANLDAARAQLQTAQLNLERTAFKLPFNGRVINSNIAVGQYIVAGQSYGEVFDTASLEVTASLEEQQLEWLLDAKSPAITFNGSYLGKTFSYTGKLKRSAATLDTNTRFAKVRFDFIDSLVDILPGVFTQIEITGRTLNNVMLLPLSAMQSRGIVWRIENGQLKLWQPTVIYTNTDYIAVEGLAEPITVVTSRVFGGAEGMQVKVVNGGHEAGHE